MDWKTIRQALRFRMVDHLLIRICMASPAATNRHGVLPPPPEDKPYGPDSLPKWASKTLDTIGRDKLFHALPVNRATIALLSFGQRALSCAVECGGSWGVPIAFVLIGVLSGLAFLPTRIFTGSEITLPRMLIPLMLGALFVVWQLCHLFIWLFSNKRRLDKHVDRAFRQGIRAIMPYLRWQKNLLWLAFWLVVLAMTMLEYAKHQQAGKDYFYQPVMRMERRMGLINLLNSTLPEPFRLPLDSLAWADISYRQDGYKIEPSDSATGRQYARSPGIDEYAPEQRIKLEEPEYYAESWFHFLIGVILVFGLAPRLVALPLFGALLLASKVRLYRDFERDPYADLLKRLNAKPSVTIGREGPIIVVKPPIINPPHPADSIPKLVDKKVLVIAYEACVNPNDVNRYGSPADVEIFPRAAGDAAANRDSLDWLRRYNPAGKMVVICRLSSTPDKPFIKYVEKVRTIRVCELDFMELWSASDRDTKGVLRERCSVWVNVMKKIGLDTLLPRTVTDVVVEERNAQA